MARPAEPLDTAQLLAFARTVEARSLSRAATELRVPRATLSRRLARLEARLGVRLLKRTTRQLSLTDAGQALYLHARTVLDAVARAEASVQRGDGALRGELRISIPPTVNQGLHEVLVDFARQHPEVRVFVHASTQHVDLISGGYDVAVRATPTLEPGLVARTLVKSSLIAVAAPGYLARHGAPRTPAELGGHRCLMMFQRGEVPETHWPLRSGKRLRVTGAFFANEPLLLVTAAKASLGIALVPESLVRDDLDAGALVAVLPTTVGVESRVSVVFAERELMPAHLRAFIDALTRWVPTVSGRPRPVPVVAARPARAKRPRRTARGRSSTLVHRPALASTRCLARRPRWMKRCWKSWS